MQKSIISLMVVGIAAGAIGYNLRSNEAEEKVSAGETPATVSVMSSTHTTQTTTDFTALLNQEVAARKALEQEVAGVKKQLAELTKGNVAGGTSPSQIPSSDKAAAAAHAAMGMSEGGNNWFNAQALVDAGVDVTVADQIKQQYESQEMKKLYLRDQAAREGWLRSERYLNELEKLDNSDSIREQYGDKAYDAYLYAAGLPNRVEIESVLENSPASAAGLQAGDRIISYDNQRIYTGQELRDATAKGKTNETITVEVERSGESRQVYLPRGPLGVRMNSISIAP